MLTITDYLKKIQWEVSLKKEGNTLKAQEAPHKPVKLPMDEVVLQKRVKVCVRDDEYLLATYWG